MGKELFEQRKLEFKQIIQKENRLPKVWEFKFTDGADARLWFDGLTKVEKYKDFINEVNGLLSKNNIHLLNDSEKEEQFLNGIKKLGRVPFKEELYFSDNSDMYMWYMSYKKRNKNFETTVHNNLKEYQDFDLVNIWPLVKNEFINVIKQLKRIPEHGEVILQNDIDVRTIYDKLETFDKKFVEKLLLHLQTYNKKGLTIDERISQITEAVSSLGYIPDLQEIRFSDGTDMFTWYIRYKDRLPNLEKELNSKINIEPQNKKLNIYLIPNFRKTGGKFFTICSNVGKRLDLSQINSFEEAQKLDPSIVKRGGAILKKDEEIDFIDFMKGKSK